MADRLSKQIDFIKEVDKEKLIGRQNFLTDGSRKENDAEHAWHLALMAILLAEYSNEPIDILKTVTMVLIHDIVEIDAGDTYAYDEAAHHDKDEREAAAAKRIFGLLPEDQGAKLKALFEEFEAGETAESRFARSLDRFQPMMLNHASGGKSWVEHSVRLSQVLTRNATTSDGSKELWEFAKENFITPNIGKTLINDKEI